MGVLHLPMISLILLMISHNLSFNVLSIAAQNNLTQGNYCFDEFEEFSSLLFSPNMAFDFRFSSLGDSTFGYVGIWYNDDIPVWVANRQTPSEATSNVCHVILSLSSGGNLTLQSRTGGVLWSTNTSNMSQPVVQLLDSGNLVLTDGGYDESDNSSIVWQSFDYPTDTLLPGMKLGWDLKANRDRRLTSWRSTSDPSPGPYSYGVDRNGVPELYIWNMSTPVSRGEPWDDTPTSAAYPTFSLQFITTNDEIYYMLDTPESFVQNLIRLNRSGFATMLWLPGGKRVVYAENPADRCDRYGECGAFGVCNIVNTPICSCMGGFDPTSPVDWSVWNNSGGCVRRTPLNCPEDGDKFFKVSGVKLPATKEAALRNDLSFDQCRDWCLQNCSCAAFAFLSKNSGCISWLGDLVDTRLLTNGRQSVDDLYVKLAGSEFGKYPTNPRKRSHAPVAIFVAVSLAIIILCSIILLTWIRCKHRWTKLSAEKMTLGISTMTKLRESEKTSMSSLYPLSSIIEATDNFSSVNKLGEGGFGSVYKGKLIDGQEIAVKRLAAKSGQGKEEFENEIILIAKIQHRNLVRLLGYCIHGEEKILIYEYMPNKSLDYFLYDTTRRAQLDWSRRLHIIEGISQGLLYLHKHSRLRIIHRDLKASNILLDADMNPKISDFGLARIFGANETEANTNRIVGTYGYMSPEYAAEGLFSIKSDVFSFGVLLLEITSGSKNTSYHRDGNTLNLLGYAWELWKEQKLLELVDPSFDETCAKQEILRCIHIALMCVQENAIDRPNMSSVITMLSSDSAIVDPKQPAFFNVRNPAEEEIHSINEATMTTINGR